MDAQAKIVSVSFVGDYAVDFDPGRQRAAAARTGHPRHPRIWASPGEAPELSDRADSILLGAQAIVNERTAKQLRSTLTALEGTLKAAAAHHADLQQIPTRAPPPS